MRVFIRQIRPERAITPPKGLLGAISVLIMPLVSAWCVNGGRIIVVGSQYFLECE